LSGNIFVPAELKTDTDTDSSSGHHESSDASDASSMGTTEQPKTADLSTKSKKSISTSVNSVGASSQHTLSNPASASTASTVIGASTASVLGEERVVKQIIIPRNLPLGIEMEIKHLSAKLQKRVMKCNELRKQVSIINERKNQLEKDLDLLQKSEKHAQVLSTCLSKSSYLHINQFKIADTKHCR